MELVNLMKVLCANFQPPSVSLLEDNGEQGEALNVYISGDWSSLQTIVDIFNFRLMVLLTHSMDMIGIRV